MYLEFQCFLNVLSFVGFVTFIAFTARFNLVLVFIARFSPFLVFIAPFPGTPTAFVPRFRPMNKGDITEISRLMSDQEREISGLMSEGESIESPMA